MKKKAFTRVRAGGLLAAATATLLPMALSSSARAEETELAGYEVYLTSPTDYTCIVWTRTLVDGNEAWAEGDAIPASGKAGARNYLTKVMVIPETTVAFLAYDGQYHATTDERTCTGNLLALGEVMPPKNETTIDITLEALADGSQ